MQALTFPASGRTLTADLPLTPPTPNRERDDKHSDVVIPHTNNFKVSLAVQPKHHTPGVSPNTNKQPPPLSVTLPPTPRTRNVTSQSVQLSLRPDSRRGAEDDNTLIRSKIKGEVGLNSRGTPLKLTYPVLASSLSISLLIVR